MPNPYVNKVARSNGATLIDISDTTAVEADVAEGKYFYLATGEKVEGTGSGGGGGGTRTIVVTEQTITASSTYTSVTNYAEVLVIGEQYICTVDGVEYGPYYGVDLYGSVAIGDINANGWLFEYDRGMYFTTYNSSLYGSHTVKVEKVVESGGGGSATLTTKTISANGTYSASDDSADGYSSVTVNVPSQAGAAMNVQTEQSTSRRNNTALGSVTSLTCSTAGTYDVYWTCARSNTSGTWGSQLYINGTAYGTENTTFSDHVQNNHLTGITIPADATVDVYGRSRSGYYIYVPQLTIVQTA